jgi:hypothetical protein
MTRTYLVSVVNPITSQAIPGVKVTVHSGYYEFGGDADGRQGERREEITAIEVDSETPLPEWADREARDIGYYKWIEGR